MLRAAPCGKAIFARSLGTVLVTLHGNARSPQIIYEKRHAVNNATSACRAALPISKSSRGNVSLRLTTQRGLSCMDGHVCCEVRVLGCVDVENRAILHVGRLYEGVPCSLGCLYLEHYIFIRH